MDITQEKYQSCQNRDQIDILHDLLQVHLTLSLHQGLSVGPYDDRLYAHKTTGIDYPFLPQDGRDQRQDQITCIGINQRRRLHFIHFQKFSQDSTISTTWIIIATATASRNPFLIFVEYSI